MSERNAHAATIITILALALTSTASAKTSGKDMLVAHGRMILAGSSSSEIIEDYLHGKTSHCTITPGHLIDCDAGPDAEMRFRFKDDSLVEWSMIDLDSKRCGEIGSSLLEAWGFPKGDLYWFPKLVFSFRIHSYGCGFSVMARSEYER